MASFTRPLCFVRLVRHAEGTRRTARPATTGPAAPRAGQPPSLDGGHGPRPHGPPTLTDGEPEPRLKRRVAPELDGHGDRLPGPGDSDLPQVHGTDHIR